MISLIFAAHNKPRIHVDAGLCQFTTQKLLGHSGGCAAVPAYANFVAGFKRAFGQKQPYPKARLTAPYEFSSRHFSNIGTVFRDNFRC